MHTFFLNCFIHEGKNTVFRMLMQRNQQRFLNSDESTLGKRAAFVGMRGRRTPLELGYDDFLYMPYIQDLEEGLEQRERRAGFVGMRG